MGRRMNDGNLSGIKQDKFRNSRFEYEETFDDIHFGGVSRQTPNTLGGKTAENRGRRSAGSARRQWSGSPFENGESFVGRGPKGYERQDDSLYEDVCDILSYSADLDASEIEVKVKDGIVFLSGCVSDRRSKKLAEEEIDKISGIKDIQNQLRISKNQDKDLH